MQSPDAEVDVDEPLVRALLADQVPDLATRPVRRLDAGWDNTLWRVGDDLLARLPRRALAVPLLEHEQRWLAPLAPGLPLPIPVPVHAGRPAAGFPWPWSIVPWFAGVPGDREPPMDPGAVANQLGGFLRALHRPAPPDAPRNPWRGVPLVDRRDAVDERLTEVAVEVDTGAVRAVWDRACAAPGRVGPPTWLHGDLHPANLVVADRRLAAVVDFGDVCTGDPATDLAAAWMLLPRAEIDTFARAYGGLDEHLEARARGWAVFFGLMLLAIGLGDRPTYAPIGRRALANAVAHDDPGH